MKTINSILFATLLLTAQTALTQGFINLNFESANVAAYGPGPTGVPTTNGIPGWTAYIFGNPQSYIFYNTLSLGAASVDLQGTNSGFTPIQGRFFVLLQGNSGGQPISAGIGQTGQIPMDALALTFWGISGQSNVTFNGQVLNVNRIGTTGSYGIYGADISAYAGQTGELLFTAYAAQWQYVDNIQFLSTPIPEPGSLALAALGAVLVGGRCWRKHHSQ